MTKKDKILIRVIPLVFYIALFGAVYTAMDLLLEAVCINSSTIYLLRHFTLESKGLFWLIGCIGFHAYWGVLISRKEDSME